MKTNNIIPQIKEYYLISIDDEIKFDNNDNTVHFINWYGGSNSEKISKNPYFCFAPKDFFHFNSWIFENDYFRVYGEYENTNEWDDDCIFHKHLLSIETLIDKFIFLKLKVIDESNDEKFFIEERYDPKDVFGYWMKKNHFDSNHIIKQLGLGQNIFNLLPNNSNYYDRNIICSCGIVGCHSEQIWYVKYENSYCVPFVINQSYYLVFDIDHHIQNSNWEEEDFSEEFYENDGPYNIFPFLFAEKDFQVFDKFLFANGDILNKYSQLK